MGFGDDVGGDVLDELAFCLEGILAVGGQAEPFGDTENMGVHRHGRLVPDDGADDVGGLASDALKGLEVIDVIGYDAVVSGDEALRHLDQMFRLRARITDGFDVFEDLVGGSCRQGFGGWVRGKEGRGDHVNALVGALGGEHDGYEALEGVSEMEFAFRDGHVGLEPSEDTMESFFCRHLVISLFR